MKRFFLAIAVCSGLVVPAAHAQVMVTNGCPVKIGTRAWFEQPAPRVLTKDGNSGVPLGTTQVQPPDGAGDGTSNHGVYLRVAQPSGSEVTGITVKLIGMTSKPRLKLEDPEERTGAEFQTITYKSPTLTRTRIKLYATRRMQTLTGLQVTGLEFADGSKWYVQDTKTCLMPVLSYIPIGDVL